MSPLLSIVCTHAHSSAQYYQLNTFSPSFLKRRSKCGKMCLSCGRAVAGHISVYNIVSAAFVIRLANVCERGTLLKFIVFSVCAVCGQAAKQRWQCVTVICTIRSDTMRPIILFRWVPHDALREQKQIKKKQKWMVSFFVFKQIVFEIILTQHTHYTIVWEWSMVDINNHNWAFIYWEIISSSSPLSLSSLFSSSFICFS